jgi:hypothetical protein
VTHRPGQAGGGLAPLDFGAPASHEASVDEPQVRARHLKTTLSQVRLAPQRQAILAALPPGLEERIESAYGGDFLPLELDVELARAIRCGLTPDVHHEFCVGVVTRSFEGPLLGTLVQAALGMLGRDLRRLAGWIPKGWWLVFRGAGRWSIEVSAEAPEVRLRLSGLPRMCTAEDHWAVATAASLSAVCRLAGVSGRVALVGLDRELGRIDYLMRWSP